MEPRIFDRPQHPISRRNIDANVLRVLYRLTNAGHLAYLVGGSVRDLMLARKPKDFDLATSAHPQQVRDLFRNSRLIGRRFRLVHVFFGPQNIEVATFRRRSEELDESDPMIRHDNTFGTADEDAFRRDFTVNALFYDPSTFRVIDYTGGVEDLSRRVIRTVGDPEVRMREDPVRMMRAVRFAAKLDFEIEPVTSAAIERNREDLLKASVPRLVEETYRTFTQPAAARALALMERLELLAVVMPWLSEHLRAIAAPLEETPTARTLAALGEAIAHGFAPTHGFVLACLMLDFWRAHPASQGEAASFDLVAELRERGFPRGDSEQMRLLLDAFVQIASQERRARRLVRRPYFGEMRRLFALAAPACEIDPSLIERLAQPYPMTDRVRPAIANSSAGDARPRRRRRRHRAGRGRRRPRRPLESARTASGADPAPAPDDSIGGGDS